MDFKKHCLCEFSKYVEFNGEYVVTSDMTPRIHEAIVLGPVGNLQATQKVFCLETGLVLKRRVNMILSMPNRVTKKMNQWGERTNRKNMG